MSEDNQSQKQSHSDEIDLRELFASIGKFFKNIFIGFIMILVHIKNATQRNIKLIICLGVFGGIAGIAFYYLVPDYYQSSLLLRSSYLNGRLMESSIDKLEQLCLEDDRTQLAKVLKIDTVVANKIKGFSYEPFVSEAEIVELEIFKEQLKNEIEDEAMINRFVERLSMDNKSTYRINVLVYDNSIIPQLEQPILNYFKENPFVSKRLQIQTETLKLKAKNIEEELNKLDSLKNILFKNFNSMAERSRAGSNNVILSDEQFTNPISVFTESRKQYEQKLDIQRELFLEPQFELIDGFTQYASPESPGLLKSGFFGGLIGIGLSYVFIIIGMFGRYLSRVESQELEGAEKNS